MASQHDISETVLEGLIAPFSPAAVLILNSLGP